MFCFSGGSGNIPILANKIRRCYAALVSSADESERYQKAVNHNNEFFSWQDTKGLNWTLYKDLNSHFKPLVEALSECERFVKVEGPRVEKFVYHLSYFLYNDRGYQKFIARIVARNPKVPKEQLEDDYFTFAMLMLMTRNDTVAKEYLPQIFIFGGIDECLAILEPHLERDEIKGFRQVYHRAANEFHLPIAEIDILKEKQKLHGNCDYLK
jgi:hypothetical protein